MIEILHWFQRTITPLESCDSLAIISGGSLRLTSFRGVVAQVLITRKLNFGHGLWHNDKLWASNPPNRLYWLLINN